MKIIYIIVLMLLLFAGASYAACPEPDIKVYDACCSNCPDAVTHTFAYADCINDCIAMWSDMQDEHYSCLKTEREDAEKKRIERENKLRGIEEAKVMTVSTVEGMIWLTNSQGLVNKLSNSELLDMKPGSVLRSDPGSTAAVTLREGDRLQLGPDSQFTYIDGEPIIEGEPEKMKYTYQVTNGRVWYRSENPNTQYEIHTSQGTVVNRETDFVVEVEPDMNRTSVYLHEGMLDVNTTAGEWLVLNPGEMIHMYSAGAAEVSNFSMEDWDGLVNSIGTGTNFTPSWKKIEESAAEQKLLKASIMKYSIIVGFVLLIIIGAVMIARRKRK